MKVAVIMGSTSDYEIMSAAIKVLEEFGVEYEKKVISAHRTPDPNMPRAPESAESAPS